MLSKESKKKLLEFLKEDISGRDVTTELVEGKKCKAEITAKEPCILAGLEEAAFLFSSQGLKVKSLSGDSNKIKKNKKILCLQGNNKKILSAERTALNILSRMSGIASLTRKAVDLVGKRKTKIASTRKTCPGFNLFDKKAVLLGGGILHRANLSEAVLIKDNHLKFFSSPMQAVEKAREKYGKKLRIEVEVTSLSEALDAVKAKPDIIMLDNFSPKQAEKAIKALRPAFNGLIELSGGINFKNLKAYACLEPDWISMGCLTQNVEGKNFSLDIKVNK